MMADNLDRALACVVPKAAERQRSILTAIGKEKMREAAEEMRTMQEISITEDSARFRIRRTETHGGKIQDIAYCIYLTNVLGEWKVENC